MATLVQLCELNQLFRLDPQLGRELEDRHIYLLAKARQWFEKMLPKAGSTWNIEESPIEQVDALIAAFCSGQSLAIGHTFKPLRYREKGIWELKTADVRMFGWFVKKDIFIVSACDLAEQIKNHNLYSGYCSQVDRDRSLLALDEPKSIIEEDPNAVVSNWHTP